jgi:ElaB/YqjD/DUF883 family membrane-anchored ribosome-binding protein
MAWRQERAGGSSAREFDDGVRAAPPRRPADVDLDGLVGDLGALVHGTMTAAQDLRRVTGRVRAAVADLADAVGEAWDVSRAHGGGAARATGRALESRPYVAIGLAAAIAVVAGFAVRRWSTRPAPPHAPEDGWDHFV